MLRAGCFLFSTLNSDLNGLHFATVNISGRTDANGQIWVSSPVAKSGISFIDIIGTVRDTGSLPFMIIALKDFDGDNTLVFRCIATNNSTFNYKDINTKVIIAYKNDDK